MFEFEYEPDYDNWKRGYQVGYEDCYIDMSTHYEQRISAIWAELQTLAARVSYLEKHTGLGDRNEK